MGSPKRIWDNYVKVGEVDKNERLKFVLFAATRDGYRYLVVREFYFSKKVMEWRPGRDGIMIPLKMPVKVNGSISFLDVFDKLMDAMSDAKDTVMSIELEDENNAVYAKPAVTYNEEDTTK